MAKTVKRSAGSAALSGRASMTSQEEEALRLLRVFAREAQRRPLAQPYRPDKSNRYVCS